MKTLPPIAALLLGVIAGWWGTAEWSEAPPAVDRPEAVAPGPEGASSTVSPSAGDVLADCATSGAGSQRLGRALVHARARFVHDWGRPMLPGPDAPDEEVMTQIIEDLAARFDIEPVATSCRPYPCRFRVSLYGSLADAQRAQARVQRRVPTASVGITSMGHETEEWSMTVSLLDRTPQTESERYYAWRLATLLDDDSAVP